MTTHRHRIGLLIGALVAIPTLALAQTPFDMSPERGGGTEAPTLQQPDGGIDMPFDFDPPAEPAPALPPASVVTPAAPRPPVSVDTPVAPQSPARKPAERVAGGIERFIIPAPTLRFEGEVARRSWGVALTAEQAARATELVLTTNSSIYVAPEDSQLRVTINDQVVLEEALGASENGSRLSVPLGPSNLRAGINVFTLDVSQRHRTDCTVESTYQLWSDIVGAGTGLVFGGADPDYTTLDDLSAVGFDADGTTTLRIVLPRGERMLAEVDLLRLVQAIALRGNFRQQVVRIASTVDANVPPGTLQVAVGTAVELESIPGVPADAAGTPTVAFVTPAGQAPLLVVSGPNRQGVNAAIDYIAQGVDRPADMPPTVINTTPWLMPPVQLLRSGRTLTFAELDLPTEEFSGRRFKTEFHVGIPDDFYAEAYGEATILLDAAYTSEVKPGSHLDVFVNGFIAANMPLTSRDGDIFRHQPIKVALTNFRPGVNRITVEAQLDTEADAICAPGTTAEIPDRFAIFDTSEFRMPDFARIERWPNISALVGAGSPFARSEVPVQVVLGRANEDVYSAAATFLARMAIAASRIIPTEIGRQESLGDRPAIFFGALDQFSAITLAEIGIEESSRNDWIRRPRTTGPGADFTIDPDGISPNAFGAEPTTGGTYDRWQNEKVNPGGIRGGWLAFESWLNRTFDLSFSSLQVMSRADPLFAPSDRTTLFVAESPASTDRSWTLVAAPTVEDLVEGVSEVTARRYWQSLAGRIASFDASTGVEVVPAESQRFVMGEGFSLHNMRLIAANWLSVNIVGYAFALLVLCIVLGICTTALLSRLGRRS